MIFLFLSKLIYCSFQEHYGFESNFNISVYNEPINVPQNYFISNSFLEHINVFGGSPFEFYHRTIINLLIQDSMFFNCSSDVSGGVLFFQCPNNGNLIMERICGNSCFAPNYQFSFIDIHSTKKNILIYCSITKCSPDHLSRDQVLTINNGNTSINNFNSSHNRLYTNSVFSLTSTLNVNMSFLTIVDNLVTNSVAISMNLGSSNCDISYLNLIGNNSPSGYVIYMYYSFYFYRNCIVIDNFNSLFYYIYSGSYGYCLITQSWIRHQSTFKYDPQHKITFGTTTLYTTATLQLSHYSTHHCYNGENYYQNEISPCQTLPPIYPSPTQCINGTINPLILLNQIFYLLFIHLIII